MMVPRDYTLVSKKKKKTKNTVARCKDAPRIRFYVYVSICIYLIIRIRGKS